MKVETPTFGSLTEPIAVIALVSKTSEHEQMLIRSACIGNIVLATAFDSCATNCFVSEKLSEELEESGYTSFKGPITYDVRQGNPLCVTNKIHMLPIVLVNEKGRIVRWDMCLFIVANTGADAIIGYPTLSAGGIISYNPPEGYEQTLLFEAVAAKMIDEDYITEAKRTIRDLRNYSYGPPTDLAACFSTRTIKTVSSAINAPAGKETKTNSMPALVSDSETSDSDEDDHTINSLRGTKNKLKTQIEEQEATHKKQQHHTKEKAKSEIKITDLSNFTQQNKLSTVLLSQDGSVKFKNERQFIATQPIVSLKVATEAIVEKKRSKKGATLALTPERPFGENPPLPEEVTDALQTLKQLSEQTPESLWTPEQLSEIQQRLSQNRPTWSSCLTMSHVHCTFDAATAQIIEDLMDSDRFQKSVFCKSLREPAKVRQFEIPQKPGADWWNPPKVRRFKNPLYFEVVDKMLDWQIADGLLSESTATRPAIVTVVEKEGRDLRCCFDYRLRNERSEVSVFPMPDIQDHLDDAMGYEYYCSFDMAKMFNQIEIKEEHRELAAFITHRGVFNPHRIQFGLAGGPQHAVREVGGLMQTSPLTNGKDFTLWALEENKKGKTPPYIVGTSGIVAGSNLIPFIDDVFLKSNDKDGLVKMVTLFFEFCEQYHLLLSRKKANICKTYLKMLGMVVSKKGKHLDPSRIISLLEAVRPRSKITMQALLCSYNFVRMFVPNFSSIVSPLYDATKGIVWKGKGSDKSKGIHEVDPEFIWTETMTRAYDQLRSALLEAPILVTPDWNFPLFLSVDASIRGEGWVLWQLLPTTVQGNKVAVAILYGSRKYNETEAAWETTRQEATAIKDALIDVDEYVFGQSFYLFSDHLNLRWMHNSINRAVIRMRNFLSQYRMTIVHCPGIWNNADSHSRLEHNLETTAIASDLNGATEARLQEGKPMLISIGTDTNQDNVDKFNEGTVKPVCVYKDTHDTERVTALNTNTSFVTGKCNMTNCSLCTDMPDLSDDSDTDTDSSEDENEAQPFTNAKCFMTQEKREAYAHENYMNVEWTGVISQVLHSTHSTMSPTELTDAASEWNSKETKTPCLTDILPQLDKEDVEDYNWCGRMERLSLVYRTVTPQKEKKTGVQQHSSYCRSKYQEGHNNSTHRLLSAATCARAECLY